MRERRFAVFVDDVLDECATMRMSWTIPPGVEWVPPELPEPSPAPSARQRSMPISRPCLEQFRDRRPLATCAMELDREVIDTSTAERDGPDSPPAGVELVVSVDQANYNFETALQDDQRMRECMEGNGEWNAVASDSPEYARARLEHHSRELERASRRIRR